MSDTAEVKTANMETNSALPPEETERLGTEIVAVVTTCYASNAADATFDTYGVFVANQESVQKVLDGAALSPHKTRTIV